MSDVENKYCSGRRIGFTVIQERDGVEIRYDATQLNPVFADGTMKPALAFVCSGRQHWIPFDQIKAVEFHNIVAAEYDGKQYWQGISHCGVCDSPLTHQMERPTKKEVSNG